MKASFLLFLTICIFAVGCKTTSVSITAKIRDIPITIELR